MSDVKKMDDSAAPSARRRFAIKEIYSRYGVLIILAIMIVASSLLSPAFLTGRNVLNVLRQMSIITIIAFGSTMVIISGMIDLSPGSVVALSGVIGTSVYVMTGSIALGLVSGVATGALTGLVCGFLVTKFDLPPFIVTLAMMTGARGMVLLYTGGKPIINIGDFTILGQGNLLSIPVPILIMFVILALVLLLVKRTPFGRYIYAIGGNEAAAIASGVNVKGIKTITFILAGMLTGLAGVILMSRINSGQPSAGLNFELDAITTVVIGGTSLSGGIGTITGTLAGGVIVGILSNILNLTNVSPYWQQIVKGLVIVMAVIMDIKTKGSGRSK
jgi:inositol transport system permease protein